MSEKTSIVAHTLENADAPHTDVGCNIHRLRCGALLVVTKSLFLGQHEITRFVVHLLES